MNIEEQPKKRQRSTTESARRPYKPSAKRMSLAVVDDSFNEENPNRWNRNTMRTLNNNKIKFSERMLNPRIAEEVADRRDWDYKDDEDVDGDGVPDIVLRNKHTKKIEWFNGHRQIPATKHTYGAQEHFIGNPDDKRLPRKPTIRTWINKLARLVIDANEHLSRIENQLGVSLVNKIAPVLKRGLVFGLLRNPELTAQISSIDPSIAKSAWNSMMRKKETRNIPSGIMTLIEALTSVELVNSIANAFQLKNGTIQVNESIFSRIIENLEETNQFPSQVAREFNRIIRRYQSTGETRFDPPDGDDIDNYDQA